MNKNLNTNSDIEATGPVLHTILSRALIVLKPINVCYIYSLPMLKILDMKCQSCSTWPLNLMVSVPSLHLNMCQIHSALVLPELLEDSHCKHSSTRFNINSCI